MGPKPLSTQVPAQVWSVGAHSGLSGNTTSQSVCVQFGSWGTRCEGLGGSPLPLGVAIRESQKHQDTLIGKVDWKQLESRDRVQIHLLEEERKRKRKGKKNGSWKKRLGWLFLVSTEKSQCLDDGGWQGLNYLVSHSGQYFFPRPRGGDMCLSI